MGFFKSRTFGPLYLLIFSHCTYNCFEQYDDDEGDRVLLATDGDLVAAIEHARSAGWKVSFSLLFLGQQLDCFACRLHPP